MGKMYYLPFSLPPLLFNTNGFDNFSSMISSLISRMNQQCKVCGEPAAGFHFGAFTCEGCKVSENA